MLGTHHALELMATNAVESVPETVVLFGSDQFLISQAKQSLLHCLHGSQDSGDAPLRQLQGPVLDWRDVNDELSTGSLFSMGQSQPVVIQEAATFISRNRDPLEDWVQHPGSTCTLILITDQWAANTKLYKLVDKHGLQIQCDPPIVPKSRSKAIDIKRITQWLTAWTKSRYQLKLTAEPAHFLLELSQNDFGLMDTSLAKLSLLLDPGTTITHDHIKTHVGGWKAESVWTAIDEALDGAPDQAIACLHPIFQAGDHPLSVMGQMAWTLRRYALAYDHYNTMRQVENQSIDIVDSLKAAGFRPWQGEIDKAANRLRRLGRRRLDVIHRWLLDVDLALKSSHSREDLGRQLIERLLVQLAI